MEALGSGKWQSARITRHSETYGDHTRKKETLRWEGFPDRADETDEGEVRPLSQLPTEGKVPTDSEIALQTLK